MVRFVKQNNGGIVCANDDGLVFGEIIETKYLHETSKNAYVYFPINNNEGHNSHDLLAIQEKLEELNKPLDEEREEDYRGMLKVMETHYRNFEGGHYVNELERWRFGCKKLDITEVLNERQKTHGEFSEVSKTYSDFIKILEKKGFFDKCEDHHRLAIDVIIQKLSRILNGDMNFDDHWLDIIGYSELVLKQLDKNKKQD